MKGFKGNHITEEIQEVLKSLKKHFAKEPGCNSRRKLC
jgi:hypothetical protein